MRLLLLFFACSMAFASPPNVLLILTDDQGSLDLGCFGAADLHTPHLDKLATEGVRFTNFYVGSPVCSPSRAALLTGRHPHRNGVPNNVGPQGLPAEEVTIAEMLKPLGYRTACIGKWHLGSDAEYQPRAQGFDHAYGILGGCVDNYGHFFYWDGPNRHDLYRNGEEVWEYGEHLGDLAVREAKQFIRASGDTPFFVYLPFNLPHYPVQPKREFVERYAQLEEPRRSYAALISQIDYHVGEVLSEIDVLGKRENTIVIFLSDHGHSTEERNFFGGGYCGSLRGAKFSFFEGGIRVPCIVRWPGHVPEGETRAQVAWSLDWLPTIAEWCGAQLPEKRLNGRSLALLIADATSASPHEWLHWQLGEQTAVRQGPWKLILNPVDTESQVKLEGRDAIWLSNLEQDETERKNLAAVHSEVVQQLQALHGAWESTRQE